MGHRREQHAEVGAVDAQLLLRERRQADLASDDLFAISDATRGQHVLDGVGAVQVVTTDQVADRFARLPGVVA